MLPVPESFAGLWDEWKDPEGRVVKSCTILTTEANSLVAEMHDRMPVIVPREAYDPWLDPDSSLQEVLALLKLYESSAMHKYAVSTTLNNSQKEGPEMAAKTEIKTPAQGTLFQS
jgi:putative SOS response-associated peptidase YedK